MDASRRNRLAASVAFAVCVAATAAAAGFDGMPTAFQVEMMVLTAFFAGCVALIGNLATKKVPAVSGNRH